MINTVGTDGFLESLHALLLMDDTVLLATSRDRILNKFQIVDLFCKEYGMSSNVKKRIYGYQRHFRCPDNI